MAETTYRLFESGNRRPGPESLRALEKLYESSPPSDQPNDLGELVAAIREQNQMVGELVATLREQRPTDPEALASMIAGAIATQLRQLLASSEADQHSGTP